jgi:N-acetylglucosaminyldiphosphoundecaprenol N-acetyl-beta-D-mannosaminyltransferase
MTKVSCTHMPRQTFGFRITPLSAKDIIQRVLVTRHVDNGVGLIVTPNLDHVVRLQTDQDFVAAYSNAEIITADGFPVYHYARLWGAKVPHRVTGCDLAEELFRHADIGPEHRLFLVGDSEETVGGVEASLTARGIEARLAAVVPPFGFENDAAYCESLVDKIVRHGTTILLMGVGAPKSEVFVNRHHSRLPPCWALCIGYAIRIEAGTARRAPKLWRQLNLEWLWRLAGDPRRLCKRYAFGAVNFLTAVIRDISRGGRRATPVAILEGSQANSIDAVSHH